MIRAFCAIAVFAALVLSGCGRAGDEVMEASPEEQKKVEDEMRAGQEEAMKQKMQMRRKGR